MERHRCSLAVADVANGEDHALDRRVVQAVVGNHLYGKQPAVAGPCSHLQRLLQPRRFKRAGERSDGAGLVSGIDEVDNTAADPDRRIDTKDRPRRLVDEQEAPVLIDHCDNVRQRLEDGRPAGIRPTSTGPRIDGRSSRHTPLSAVGRDP